MGKQIASFIPHFWSPHLEVDLEIIKGHVDAGDRVRVFVCNRELASCYSNLLHGADVCTYCVNRRRNGFELLGLYSDVETQSYVNLTDRDAKILESFCGVAPDTIDELQRIQLDSCLIGKTVFNELTSHLRETEPDLRKHREYVARAIEAGATVYLSFKNNFKQYRPDRFYTFNGRFVVANAALQAAKDEGIPFAVHDRAWVQNRYTLVLDESLHSVDYWSKQANKCWDESSEPEEVKLQVSASWYEERIAGQNQALESFTSHQNVALPASWDQGRVNLVIFNTSEFETVGMESYRLPFYHEQNAGIERIARDLLDDPQIKIYLRVHPNLTGRDNTQNRGIRDLLTNRIANLEVIPPDSPINTYSLIRNADAVISFGSTAGVEAVYMGKPSILIGPGFYKGLDVCHVPSSHDDLIALIKTRAYRIDEQEKARRKFNALKYGYFGKRGGLEYKYFTQFDVNDIRPKVALQKPIDGNREISDSGWEKELQSRVDLQPSNPLTATLQEAAQAHALLLQENAALKAQLEDVRRLSVHSPASPVSRRIRALGRSLKTKLSRTL
jgi:hypothetical protein